MAIHGGVGVRRKARCVFLWVSTGVGWLFLQYAQPFVLTPAMAQSPNRQMLLAFKIPAQPLASALAAYGAATGFDVFYDADLADRQRSTEVVGTLSPSEALRILLIGSGYEARDTGRSALTIVRAPRTKQVDATSPAK